MLKYLIILPGYLLTIVTAAGLLARFVPPDSWWPPAVIALLLPGLLAGTLLFFTLALYRRWWAALCVSGIVLLGSLPLRTRLFATGQPQATTGASIEVLLANVLTFRDYAGQSVPLPQQTDFVQAQPPDILLLQEAGSSNIAALKQASALAKRHQPKGKNIATYADELAFVHDEFLPRNPFNGFLVTDVTTPIGTLRVINLHLRSNRITDVADRIGKDRNFNQDLDRAESMFRSYGAAAATRTRQAEAVRTFIQESPYPVIVGGDFNDVPSSYVYRRLLTDRLQDAWAVAGWGIGTTFTGSIPFLRIDFLLVDKRLRVLRAELVETGFSDHLALRVALERNEK